MRKSGVVSNASVARIPEDRVNSVQPVCALKAVLILRLAIWIALKHFSRQLR
jgi:hypothetical protein